MLDEYSKYIQSLRNCLIQNGVEFSEGVNLDLSDYGNLFKLGNKIDDILLYFRLLAVGGDDNSLSGCPIPLEETIRDRLNAQFKREFSESVLPDYISLTGVGTIQSAGVPNKDVTPPVVSGISDVTERVSHGTMLDDTPETVSVSPHGIMLDDASESVQDERVSHGVLLDDEPLVDEEEESSWGNEEDNSSWEVEDSSWGEDEDYPDDVTSDESSWGEDEEETSWGDEEEEETPWNDDEEEGEISWNDEEAEDESHWNDDEEEEETPWNEDDDEGETTWNDEENTPQPRATASVSSSTPVGVKLKDRDLGDVFQDAVNDVLTKAKRSMHNFLYRKDE